jgi:hypothetical protein
MYLFFLFPLYIIHCMQGGNYYKTVLYPQMQIDALVYN